MILLGLALGLLGYTYVGYPLALWTVARLRRPRREVWTGRTLPSITVLVPVFDGERTIAATLDYLLASDYTGPRQILVLSDGSRDRTDAIVAGYASQGVELLRMPHRVGKTEMENRALDAIRGEIVVNTDAAVRVHPDAITSLILALADPTVGVASSTDVSVQAVAGANAGETSYVDYEMRLRMLETEVEGIVGASGSLYAIRAPLHRRQLPAHLSRDFSAALYAREQGFRSVSVPGALCYVPRGHGGRSEYDRKVRTMARGLMTLAHHRRLLDPRRYGLFAWMLFSHKLLRWLTPAALIVAVVAFASSVGAVWAWGLVGGGLALGALGWWWPGATAPRIVALPTYVLGGVVAGLHAWWRALRGEMVVVWEPTTRSITTPHGDRA